MAAQRGHKRLASLSAYRGGNVETREGKNSDMYPCYRANKLWGKLAKTAFLGIFGPSTRMGLFAPARDDMGNCRVCLGAERGS